MYRILGRVLALRLNHSGSLKLPTSKLSSSPSPCSAPAEPALAAAKPSGSPDIYIERVNRERERECVKERKRERERWREEEGERRDREAETL